MKNSSFSFLRQSFFTDRLVRQRQASPNTVASYRDTFRLLFEFARRSLNKEPSTLTIDDLNTPFIGSFLDHLEKERANSARSRNTRLAALHSFFKYAALQDPTRSALMQRVLAMPTKRYDRRPIDFLTRGEIEVLLAVPDQDTWAGRRDRTLLFLMAQTGLRVPELIGLACRDIVLGTGPHVRCEGTGRKHRCTPLRKELVTALHAWLDERNGQIDEPLFPNARGGFLSRNGVGYLLTRHVAVARQKCPSPQKKRISPHVLRHSAAIDLLQCGVDRTVIALWLGHENVETTQIYLQASLEMKEKALVKTCPLDVKPGRYKPDDDLLSFLKDL